MSQTFLQMFDLPSNLEAKILSSLAVVFTLSFLSLRVSQRKEGLQNEALKSVPTVANSIPFLGHIPQIFLQGPVAFARAARAKYGPIFRVNFFTTPFVLLAGKEVQSKFFTENKDFTFNAFFYKWMGTGFFPKKLSLDASNAIARKILKGQVDLALIHEQAQEFVERLKGQARTQKTVDMNHETERYLIKVALGSFFNFPVGEGFVEDVSNWMGALVFFLKVNVVLPAPIARAIGRWRLEKYRTKVMTELKRCIRLYRDDPYSYESPFLSAAFEKEEGQLLDDPDDYVAALTLQLLYGILVNARLSILNTIVDISENDSCREQVSSIASTYLQQDPPKWEEYLQNDFITAVVMETARVRVNFSGLAKLAERPGTNFGDYHIQDDDILSNCSLISQVYGENGDGNDREGYDPWKMGQDKKWGPNEVSAWGAGMHACPGKRFSILEIKLAIAYFFGSFKLDLHGSRISKRNLMGASGMFNETKFEAKLTPLE